jgi:tape measure domain-containing protein
MADQLVIKVSGNIKEYQKSLKQIKDKTKNLEDQLSSIAKKSTIAFVGLAAAVTGVVTAAAKIETMTTQFEVLTGSVGKAKKIVQDLQKFSAKTPFQLKGLAKASQQLLGFGFQADEIIPKLQEIGDVASAIGKPVEEVGFIFGQVAAAGKLTGERLLQFQERAIPIGPAIAKTMGVAEESVRDLVSKGEVNFKIFEKAFASLSKKGGFAFQGMIKQSETLEGRISTLKDNFNLLAADIGKELLPTFKSLATAATGGLQFLKENPKFAKLAANILLIGTVAAGTIAAVSTMGLAILKVSAIVGALSAAFLPATLAASGFWVALTGPIGIAVAGIAAVTAAVAGLYLALGKGEEASESISELQGKLSELRKERDKLNKTTQESIDLDKGVVDFSGDVTHTVSEVINQKSKEIKNTEKLVEAKNAEIERIEKLIEIKQKEADAVAESERKKLQAEKDAAAAKVAIEKEKLEKLRAERLRSQEEELGIALTKEEEDLERQILVDQLKNEQELNRINQLIKNEQDKEKRLGLIKKRADVVDQKRDDLRRKRLTKFQRFEETINSAKVQSTQRALGTISTLQSSENKKLVALGKAAALANITVSTAQGIAAAWALGPILGPILAPLVAIAGAAQAAQVSGVKLAKGGVFEGGVPGVDSIPATVQRRELVSPSQNFEEVIGSTRALREAKKSTEEMGSLAGRQEILIGFDGEEASQVLTARQNEDKALGISRVIAI